MLQAGLFRELKLCVCPWERMCGLCLGHEGQFLKLTLPLIYIQLHRLKFQMPVELKISIVFQKQINFCSRILVKSFKD